MFSSSYLKLFMFISAIQLTLTNVIRSPSTVISAETREEFDRQVRLETEEFLNNIFKNQIGFFNKVKENLQPDSKRYKDIETVIEKLQVAKHEQNLERKDQLYLNSFKEIHKSSLLLNDSEETGLEDDEYQKILEESGLKDLIKNLLVDVVAYFWKMAKHSGKVVETTVDRFVENMQKDKVVF